MPRRDRYTQRRTRAQRRRDRARLERIERAVWDPAARKLPPGVPSEGQMHHHAEVLARHERKVDR